MLGNNTGKDTGFKKHLSGGLRTLKALHMAATSKTPGQEELTPAHHSCSFRTDDLSSSVTRTVHIEENSAEALWRVLGPRDSSTTRNVQQVNS